MAQEEHIKALLDKLNIVHGAPPSNPFATTLKAMASTNLETDSAIEKQVENSLESEQKTIPDYNEREI